MRIELIVNTADTTELERLREQVARLRERGHEVRPRLTFEGGDAWRMAGDAAGWGADLVVAAGGDGTVNEVANGLHRAMSETGRAPRLAIVPLGTANDLAGALGIPGDIEGAMGLALSGVPRAIDVGRVDGRCFLNVSSGGFGAEATEEAAPEVKRALGTLAYLITGARKFVGLEALEARFTGEEPIFAGRFLLFAVGNSPRTGGGNRLTPRARLTDGLLDLCIVPEMSRIEFVRLLPDLRTGRHIEHPGVVYRQLTRLTVESDGELSVNADGEPLEGCRRLEYDLSPHRLTVMSGRD